MLGTSLRNRLRENVLTRAARYSSLASVPSPLIPPPKDAHESKLLLVLDMDETLLHADFGFGEDRRQVPI